MESASSAYLARDGRFFPALTVLEWALFAVLAATLAVTNIYTTLLIGWGDGGSIIAVLLAVLILRGVARRSPEIPVTNLGQTMASAGGSVGFAVATYTAVEIAQPEFQPGIVPLTLLFMLMGMVGAMIGTSVRRQMVGYFFPSGTACAVIQRTVAEADPARRQRPMRLLTRWGALGALITIPTKLTFSKGGEALLHTIYPSKAFEERGAGLAFDPLLYGIGIVVGPRIGVGMLIGGLVATFGIPEWAVGQPEGVGNWVKFMAIGVLTLPTFATIVFAFLFRTPLVVPAGFTPGKTTYTAPRAAKTVWSAIAIVGIGATAFLADYLFGLPWPFAVLTAGIAWPLCIMNGRVQGETDINPVRLVAIVLLAALAWAVAGGTTPMLGMAIIGGTLAAVACDLFQDFRTGYLLDCNPTHQTTVQLVGCAIGAVAAVPFLALLDSQVGFGPGSSLPAPGAQVWAAMAQAFAGDLRPTGTMWLALTLVSLGASAYAFLTVWPKTARFMPSIFGIGIGMLLPMFNSFAIFLGGLINLAVMLSYRKKPDASAGDDTMLVGSSMFGASAVVSVAAVIVTSILAAAGIGGVFLAS
ncbi:MAG: OPT/YSL family transporter [Kofleriaceae bacterium]